MVPKSLSTAELKHLARLGAAARIAELEREIAALRRAFPRLVPAASAEPAGPDAAVPGRKFKAPARLSRRGRRSPMSAAEKRLVSERMKKDLGRAAQGQGEGVGERGTGRCVERATGIEPV